MNDHARAGLICGVPGTGKTGALHIMLAELAITAREGQMDGISAARPGELPGLPAAEDGSGGRRG